MDSKQERAVRELLADIRDQLNDGVDDTVSILERTEDLLADLLPVPGEVDVDLDESCEDCGSTVAAHIPCPYASDLNGDDTLHWLCEGCATGRGREP